MTRESNEKADAKAKLIVSRFADKAFYRKGPRATSNISISLVHRSTPSKTRTPR
jgi:hypothetical protein